MHTIYLTNKYSGGSVFGSVSTPSQGSSVFGGGATGSSVFGGGAPAGGSVFGSTTPVAGGSVFGSATPSQPGMSTFSSVNARCVRLEQETVLLD